MAHLTQTLRGVKGGLWEVCIGLEVHAQIHLNTKLFSRSAADCRDRRDPPNSRVSFFDAAFPGTLPVTNAAAVEQVVRTGLALGCTIHQRSIFERKHYFYSDLPHGYQITQNRHPIASGGKLTLLDPATVIDKAGRHTSAAWTDKSEVVGGEAGEAGEAIPSVAVNRIQLEMDSGKSLHKYTGDQSFVDLNRAGAALMEIVLDPDIRSAAGAGEAVRSLQFLLRRLGTCDGNMEDGSMRCDLNVSVRAVGCGDMGERVEVKNMNSVRSLVAAAEAEAKRQVALLEEGQMGGVERETRGFNVDKNCTFRLRGKEGLVDYRFLPEPDLPPLVIPRSCVELLKQTLPELPGAALQRLQSEYGLPERYSRVLVCASGGAVAYFEAAVSAAPPSPVGARRRSGGRDPQMVANWVCNNLFGLLKGTLEDSAREDELERALPSSKLGDLLDLLGDGTISNQTMKAMLRIMVEVGVSVGSVVLMLGLGFGFGLGAAEDQMQINGG
ncbi:unnamed protein product [Discosporangium mesarthrocarpum]